MAVPTYNPIADSEIDPESPITSSLMRRLRDNFLALFGIDPTDPAPVIGLPPSYITSVTDGVMSAQGGAGASTTFTSNEIEISDTTYQLESIFVVRGRSGTVGGSASTDFNIALGNVFWSVSDADILNFALDFIETQYSSGTVTGVRIAATNLAQSISDPGPASFDVIITPTNTFQTLSTDTIDGSKTYTLEGRVRLDSDKTYLSLRMSVSSAGWAGIDAPCFVKAFRNKAAV